MERDERKERKKKKHIKNKRLKSFANMSVYYTELIVFEGIRIKYIYLHFSRVFDNFFFTKNMFRFLMHQRKILPRRKTNVHYSQSEATHTHIQTPIRLQCLSKWNCKHFYDARNFISFFSRSLPKENEIKALFESGECDSQQSEITCSSIVCAERIPCNYLVISIECAKFLHIYDGD